MDTVLSRARTVDVRRVLLWLVAAVPWLIGAAIGLVVYVLAFVFFAGVVGYRTIRPKVNE